MTILASPPETSVLHGKAVRAMGQCLACIDVTDLWRKLDFQVTAQLPNITFPMGRNWAGNIPVDRAGHPNDTLFFWGFEKENGALTANAGEMSDVPWGIWLNGG